MKWIKNFFKQNFFSNELPFDYRVFMIFYFIALFVSLLSSITNTMLGKGVLGVTVQWVFNVVLIVMLFVPVQLRMRASKPMLLVCTFFYVPFLSFFTAGYDGTAAFIAVLGMLLIVILYRGKGRLFLVITNILLWGAVCTVQFLYPELVVPHGAEQAKYVDYIVALIVTFSGAAWLGSYFRNAFETEQRRIESLLKRLEISNIKLAELSNLDPLTGIYNRRFLMSHLQEELDSPQNAAESYHVFMIDLDDFKLLNDTHGHAFGDEVLVKTVATVKGCLRKTDVFARYGGEEFVVVLRSTEMAIAKKIAERIRRSVESITFENGTKVTISAGVAGRRDNESLEELIHRADECLYTAKHSGKNCFATDDNQAASAAIPAHH